MPKSKLVGRGSPEYLKRELDRAYQLIAILRTKLMKEDIDSTNKPPEWAKPLSPQEIVLMGLLLKNYPRVATKSYLEDNLPKLDHAIERDRNFIAVAVSKARAKLGNSVIETNWGTGYRCSDEFAKKYKDAMK